MSGFVEPEESSVMEFPKRESSEWTDEKHSLYLKSMEASFVDQLYNSLDMRSWQTQNEYSSDAMSDRRHHASTRPSGQFKVLQHGSWSRIDFRRENYARNENNRPHISSSNPWIQHFRNGNGHRDAESPSSKEKPSLTSFSNTEVTDQNFVQEVPDIQTVNASGSKKRKSASKVSEHGNDQKSLIIIEASQGFLEHSCDCQQQELLFESLTIYKLRLLTYVSINFGMLVNTILH